MITQAAILKDGIIYTGRRHFNILQDADKIHGLGFGGLKNGIQGFVDDTGVFFTREAAREHFIECGQITVLDRLHPTLLFSEDLY